jgi:hypothetical protein
MRSLTHAAASLLGAAAVVLMCWAFGTTGDGEAERSYPRYGAGYRLRFGTEPYEVRRRDAWVASAIVRGTFGSVGLEGTTVVATAGPRLSRATWVTVEVFAQSLLRWGRDRDGRAESVRFTTESGEPLGGYNDRDGLTW